MGENIADLVGLIAALDAYHARLGGRPAPIIDGLTGDQRFFLPYARSRPEKTREEDLRRRASRDSHGRGVPGSSPRCATSTHGMPPSP